MVTIHRFFLALLVFTLLTSLSVTPSVNSAAGTWYVSPTGNDYATCSTAASPCATIAAAMVKPGFTFGDTIRVAAGTYTGASNPLLSLDQSVTLSGGWNASFTEQSERSVLDGENQRLVIKVGPNIIVFIDHFIIRRGYNGQYAWNSAIDNNGDLTVTHTQFVENGSVYAILNNATWGASLTLDQVAIENNNGGGLVVGGISVTITNSSVTGNLGNGITNIQSHLTLDNVTVSGNTTGLHLVGDTQINNSTITGNKGGSGIKLYNEYHLYKAVVRNSIIAGNHDSSGNPSECYGQQMESAGYNLVGNLPACFSNTTGSDISTGDAGLGSLILGPSGTRYHPLKSTSLAVNAGNPQGCQGSAGLLTADQRGAARVGACDIGAYEYTSPSGEAAFLAALDTTAHHVRPLSDLTQPLLAGVTDSAGTPVSGVPVIFTAPDSGPSGSFAAAAQIPSLLRRIPTASLRRENIPPTA